MFDEVSNRFLSRVASSEVLKGGSVSLVVTNTEGNLGASMAVRIPLGNLSKIIESGKRGKMKLIPSVQRIKGITMDRGSEFVILRTSSQTANGAVKDLETVWRDLSVLIADLSVPA